MMAYLKLQPLKMVLGLTAALLLNGCGSSAGVIASQDASGQTITTVHNDNLGIIVRQIRSSPAGGLFKARVIVENETNATQSLQYQFNWYDQQGDELNADGTHGRHFIFMDIIRSHYRHLHPVLKPCSFGWRFVI